jgi:hypothetical protein
MMYTLDELLMKMGAPEAKEKGQMRWHYFDKTSDASGGGSGGYAEVRLLDDGKSLVAEMKHLRPAAEDDDAESLIDDETGAAEKIYSESLYLYAQRTHGARYTVTKIAFDGEEYPHPRKSIIELGLSIFHARALDISILMVEQAFNRQDIVIPTAETRLPKALPDTVSQFLKKESWGVVVPFRPRVKARLSL